MIDSTAELSVKLFSSSFATLFEAVESLIREPYGCFEQTSSVVYPMVMALDFLINNPEKDEKTQELIDDLMIQIQKGYQRILTFKTPEPGFTWFGESPAHEGLTAYGIMELTDMNRHTNFVDMSLVY